MTHTIVKTRIAGSHLTHHLPSDMHRDTISHRLGFYPSEPDKGRDEWEGTIDGHPFAIWDFKGARWSVYASGFALLALRDVFPELTP